MEFRSALYAQGLVHCLGAQLAPEATEAEASGPASVFWHRRSPLRGLFVPQSWLSWMMEL